MPHPTVTGNNATVQWAGPFAFRRALDMFEAMARKRPVIWATHSDRLLDGLSDPAHSVVLCSLDPIATRSVRSDPAALEDWLEDYRNLGDVRASGHKRSVITVDEPLVPTKLLNDAGLQKDRLSREPIFGRMAYGDRATRDCILEPSDKRGNTSTRLGPGLKSSGDRG